MEQMQQLLWGSACYEIENYIYDGDNDEVSDLADRILPYRLILPAYLMEPLIAFIYNELPTTCSLLDDLPANAQIMICKELIYKFECLRQKLFLASRNAEPLPIVEFN